MATHSSDIPTPAEDRIEFKGGKMLTLIGSALAGGGLLLALIIAIVVELVRGGRPMRSFMFGYLAAYVFVMTIALGSLGFVLLQHLTRASWSVGVRRTAENLAGAIPLLGLLGIPIIIAVAFQTGTPFRWAIPMSRASEESQKAAAADEAELDPIKIVNKEQRAKALKERGETLTAAKWKAPYDSAKFELDPLDLAKRSYGLHWLNPWFFALRVVFYFAVWSGIILWYRKTSITQDLTGDDSLTLKMQGRAAPCLVVLALTVTGFAFDLIMSLDPHWYSTMFGVYYTANCFLASYATIILAVFLFQRAGYLRKSITVEHYHDLGKYLFGFTFFYGYIAFSQYMLMWYANIPEETEWMARHGVSTSYIVPQFDGTFAHNQWGIVVLVILFCHILIPFAGLMSRHVKRRPPVLAFWALWQLAFVAVDMYWLVMPEMGTIKQFYYGPDFTTMFVTASAVVGFGGVLLAAFGWLSSKASLRATHDPRLADSVVFQNI